MAGMMEPILERNEVPAGKAESILAAAKRTFLAAGFGAVSMDTIAREAGVSKATVIEMPAVPVGDARSSTPTGCRAVKSMLPPSAARE